MADDPMMVPRFNESVIKDSLGRWTDGVYFEIVPNGDWVRFEDYAKLLAAYQSVREENAHQKQVAEDAEVRAMVATASLAARTGGTE
jgi:hypothetical protein